MPSRALKQRPIRSFPLAFTLIELLVAVSLMSLLGMLLLSAIQQIRESSRRTQCLNNIRMTALGVLSYESTKGLLPASFINADPLTPDYSFDRSWVTEILPHLELAALAASFAPNSTIFAQGNKNLASAPSVFICPSSTHETSLRDVATSLNSALLPGHETTSSSFCINAGYWEESFGADPEFHAGVLGIRLPGWNDKRYSFSLVTDGLSNTFLLWECHSSMFFRRSEGSLLEPVSWENYFWQNQDTVRIHPGGSLQNQIYFRNDGAFRAYSKGWCGFRSGTVMVQFQNAARFVNVNNSTGAPFSTHPNLICAVNCDGSTRPVSDFLDNDVFLSSVSSADRRVNKD